jgi:hypothetical protein
MGLQATAVKRRLFGPRRVAAGAMPPAVLAALAVLVLLWSPGAPPRQAPAGAAEASGPDIQFVEEAGPDADDARASPFATAPAAGPRRADAVPGYAELSGGLKVPGFLFTTRAKRLKIYNLRREIYEYVPVPALESLEAVVEWERVDPEWRFKEAGSPEKVFTGKSYPVRMLSWRLTLRNGHEIVGHILGQPLYVEHNGKAERFILHKRQKGNLGEALDDLVYVRRAVFGPMAYNEAVEDLKARAAGAGAPTHE